MSSVPLEALVEEGLISYGIVQPGDHAADGVPIVRVGDLESGTLSGVQPGLRVARPVEARFSRTRLRGGEVVISLVGTPGRAAAVPNSLAGWNVARAVAVLRPKGVEAAWLVYALQSPACQEQIAAALNTTVQATLNLSDLKRVMIPLPGLKARRTIAEILGALDDKIAANARVVEGADRLAVTRFDAAPKLDLRPLSRLADFVNGRAYTQGPTGTGRVVIRIAELNSGIGGSTVYNDLDVPEENLARPGDLLFAWSGSLTVRRWFRSEGIVNQHIFKVIPRDGYPLWLVAAVLQRKLADFQAIAADKATTMGHIQRRHLDEPVAIPSAAEIRGLDRLMAALWHKALAAERESLHLAQLRDTLLPHLMSGRLSVRQAEHTVSNAL